MLDQPHSNNKNQAKDDDDDIEEFEQIGQVGQAINPEVNKDNWRTFAQTSKFYAIISNG